MEQTVLFPSETPLVLRIKDTLSAIFGQMPLVSLGRSAQVSKLWKEVVNNYIILDELDLGSDYELASKALTKFPRVKKIKFPKRSYIAFSNALQKEFMTEIYPKGVKHLTSISFPAVTYYPYETDSTREEYAHWLLDPLPKSCVNFSYVNFWPELFKIMDKNHSENLKSLALLLNTAGKITGSWDSFYSLIKHSTRLESLGLHYFEDTRFHGGSPDFDVLTRNLTNVLHLATQLERLNIPPGFKIDSLVTEMPIMPNLTYLYIQDSLTKVAPNTIFEKCPKLKFLHLMLDDLTAPYQITSNSLQTLLISSRYNLHSVTIECPNLEVLKILKYMAPKHIGDIHVIGPHKLEEFTCHSLIKNGLHGNFDSVKITDYNIFAKIDPMTNIEKLTLQCDSHHTQKVYESLDRLTQLPNLKTLDLINVKRLEAVPSSIFSQLSKLILRKCEIKGNELNFKNLISLKDLQIIDSTEISSIKISGCHQLSNLVLFNHAHLRTLEIKDSLSIEHVDVRNCALNISSWRQIENLPKMVNLSATILPMSSYMKIIERNPIATIIGKKVVDRVYHSSISMINTRIEWKTKEEYDESGPNILIRKVF